MCDDLALLAGIHRAVRRARAKPALGWAVFGVLSRSRSPLDAAGFAELFGERLEVVTRVTLELQAHGVLDETGAIHSRWHVVHRAVDDPERQAIRREQARIRMANKRARDRAAVLGGGDADVTQGDASPRNVTRDTPSRERDDAATSQNVAESLAEAGRPRLGEVTHVTQTGPALLEEKETRDLVSSLVNRAIRPVYAREAEAVDKRPVAEVKHERWLGKTLTEAANRYPPAKMAELYEACGNGRPYPAWAQKILDDIDADVRGRKAGAGQRSMLLPIEGGQPTSNTPAFHEPIWWPEEGGEISEVSVA